MRTRVAASKARVVVWLGGAAVPALLLLLWGFWTYRIDRAWTMYRAESLAAAEIDWTNNPSVDAGIGADVNRLNRETAMKRRWDAKDAARVAGFIRLPPDPKDRIGRDPKAAARAILQSSAVEVAGVRLKYFRRAEPQIATVLHAALVEELRSTDPHRRSQAGVLLISLGEHESDNAVRAAIHALESDPDPDVKQAITLNLQYAREAKARRSRASNPAQ